MHAGNEMIVHTFYSLSVSLDYTMIVQAGGYTNEPFSWFCYSANIQCYQNISSFECWPPLNEIDYDD